MKEDNKELLEMALRIIDMVMMNENKTIDLLVEADFIRAYDKETLRTISEVERRNVNE